MIAMHGWRVAFNVAERRAAHTSRRQRVTWDARRLLWVVSEVDITR